MSDDDDLTIQAISELQKDAARAKDRSTTLGSLGWKRKIASANRKYLHNTIIGNIQSNRRIDNKTKDGSACIDIEDGRENTLKVDSKDNGVRRSSSRNEDGGGCSKTTRSKSSVSSDDELHLSLKGERLKTSSSGEESHTHTSCTSEKKKLKKHCDDNEELSTVLSNSKPKKARILSSRLFSSALKEIKSEGSYSREPYKKDKDCSHRLKYQHEKQDELSRNKFDINDEYKSKREKVENGCKRKFHGERDLSEKG